MRKHYTAFPTVMHRLTCKSVGRGFLLASSATVYSTLIALLGIATLRPSLLAPFDIYFAKFPCDLLPAALSAVVVAVYIYFTAHSATRL